MRTQPGNRRGARRLYAAVLAPAAMLLGSTIAVGQQTSTTRSTQPAAGNAAGQTTTAAQPGAISSTRAISQGRIDQRGEVATNRGQVNPSNAPDARAASGQSTAAVTPQNQALVRDFNNMAARLDQMIATLDSSSGAERNEALMSVVQEMASQLADMRRLLLGASVAPTDEGSGAQAVFITPSGSAQAEIRRQNGLDEPLVTNTASRTGTVEIQSAAPATSGLSQQAASRRSGESSEPVTDPDG